MEREHGGGIRHGVCVHLLPRPRLPLLDHLIVRGREAIREAADATRIYHRQPDGRGGTARRQAAWWVDSWAALIARVA